MVGNNTVVLSKKFLKMKIIIKNFKDETNLVDCIRSIRQCDATIKTLEQINNDLVFNCEIDIEKFKKTFIYKLSEVKDV